MNRSIVHLLMIGLVMLGTLAGCGSDSELDDVATVQPTTTNNNAEPTGEPSAAAVVVTNPPDEEPAPTSTLYAEGEPTPTVIAGVQCTYDNPAKLEFQSFEVTRAELHACAAEVEWPAGYEIDVEKLAYYDGNNSSSAPPGGARARIMLINACLWGNYWLDATQTGDTAAAESALEYMGDTLLYFRIEGPPGPETTDPILQDPIDKAKLGDPSAMQEFLTSIDCGIAEEVRVDP